MPDGRKFCPKDCPRRAVGCRSDCPQWQEYEKEKQAEYARRKMLIDSSPSTSMREKMTRANMRDRMNGRYRGHH